MARSIAETLARMQDEIRRALLSGEIGPTDLASSAGNVVTGAALGQFRDGKIRTLNPEATERVHKALRSGRRAASGHATGTAA